ncbi:MAG TPA: flagellar biosynthesis protein FlhB [Geobacteraceae bacterium]
MSDVDKQSKTEQPTGKRRSDAEKKSGPPRSRELTSTLALMAAFMFLYWGGSAMCARIKECCRDFLGNAGTYALNQGEIHTLLLKVMGTLAYALGPFLLAMMMAGVAVTVCQGGWSFSTERITFNPGRLNPVGGVKKMFNVDALAETFKSFLKLAIVTYVAYHTLKGESEGVLLLGGGDIAEIIDAFARIAFRLVVHIVGTLLVLGALDYLFVRWRFTQNIKMTKQEVKDENRESEGDPQVKRKMRSIQIERARKRYSRIIPEADVVITNPTHFAVALKYDRTRMGAPVVIAKGADYLAQKIKEIARKNNVMMVENRFLARELFAQVKEGQEIPETLYAAVAEILAYVYGLKGKL